MPVIRTPLIDREDEVAAVRRFLASDEVGLVTLTGPGGVGKTRLALRLAADPGGAFADGVGGVFLAPVRDPALVPSAVAGALGVVEVPDQPLRDTLIAALRDRALLLLLDNCEHLLPAVAGLVADLLAACPRLKVLATSRAALRLREEQEYPLPPLALPAADATHSAEAVARYPAPALFIRRARAVRPDFALTDDAAPAVAEICRRLDGLPLAIELAASRVALLPLAALLARLDRRLPLLTTGAADLPDRHRALRAALDWSHDLLAPAEQALFASLAVFTGDATLEAIEAVGAATAPPPPAAPPSAASCEGEPMSSAPPPAAPGPPALVGRDRELAALRGALDAALAGHGSLVLIGGEAGIGKTALAEMLLAEAAARGALALVGRCYDGTETPPYGPWAEFVRPVVGDDRSPPTGPAVASQEALFRQMRDALAARAAARPLVALLDDLHWADPASLALLRVAARDLPGLPVLLLATQRSDAVSRRHPLYQLVPLLLREAPTTLIDLRPLGRADTLALVSDRYQLAAADAERLADYLDRAAQGNPLYLRELLRGLEQAQLLRPGAGGWQLGDLAGARLPTVLHQIIGGRVDRLGEEGQRLLRLAATIGQEVPLGLWARVAGVEEDALLAVVERATEAHLLEEQPDGAAVRFRHALIREALYEGTSPARRRRWHRQIGAALAAEAAPDPDAVADHLRRAGDERAVGWLIAAGERARRAFAWVTAGERFAAALGLLQAQGGDAGRRGWLTFHIAVLRPYADARQTLADARQAVDCAAEAGDRLLAAVAVFLEGLALGYLNRRE